VDRLAANRLIARRAKRVRMGSSRSLAVARTSREMAWSIMPVPRANRPLPSCRTRPEALGGTKAGRAAERQGWRLRRHRGATAKPPLTPSIPPGRGSASASGRAPTFQVWLLRAQPNTRAAAGVRANENHPAVLQRGLHFVEVGSQNPTSASLEAEDRGFRDSRCFCEFANTDAKGSAGHADLRRGEDCQRFAPQVNELR